jgi:hypothetical protein
MAIEVNRPYLIALGQRDPPISAESADRNRRRYVFDNKPGMRSRVEPGGRAEIPVCNSDNDKHSATDKLWSRTADCDNALRPRFPNRDTLGATLVRAARFGVGQLEIARADAPAHAAASDRSRLSPLAVAARSLQKSS